MKPWVYLVIGDAYGNNQLCGYHNNNGSELAHLYPYHGCKCSWDMMSGVDPACGISHRKKPKRLRVITISLTRRSQ